MSGEITITPGKTWADGEAVTYAKLDQAARPTAQLNAGAVGAREIDAASVAGALGNIASIRNHFRDPLFLREWHTAAGRTITQAAGEAFNAPDWYAVVEAGQATYARNKEAPTGSTGSGYAIKVTGHTTCTGMVRVGQQIRAEMAGALGGQFVASCMVKNGTGDTFSPVLRVYGCGTEGDWTTAAVADSVTAEVVPNTEWLRVSAAFDLTGNTDWPKGGTVEIEIPAGCLDDGAKSVQIAQPLLEAGTVASTWVPPNGVPELRVTNHGESTTPTSVPPTVADDWTKGHQRGDLWNDLGTAKTWICIDPDPAGAAKWNTAMPEYVPPAEALYERVMAAAETTNLVITAHASTWTTIELNTEVHDAAALAALDTNTVVVAAAGTYEITAEVTVEQSVNSYVGVRLSKTTGVTLSELRRGDGHYIYGGSTTPLRVQWRGTLAAADIVKFEGISSVATSTYGNAAATIPSGAAGDYVVARLHIKKLA
jgi:hypothetical protein